MVVPVVLAVLVVLVVLLVMLASDPVLYPALVVSLPLLLPPPLALH